MHPLRIACLALLVAVGFAQEWFVGPSRLKTTPSSVANDPALQTGDTVSIDAGTYYDVCEWPVNRNNLILRGVGGPVRLDATNLPLSGGKAIWVIKGGNVTVDGIEFSMAACSDKNGAGIRSEGTGLTVRNCYFHDNENGILTGANASSDIVIERCEFAYNGYGNGQSHNLYIGVVRSLTFRGNYSHHTKIGHNLKTRAQTNYIIANRIMDEGEGTASYAINVPQGGLTYIIGNLIQKGPHTDNIDALVSYAEESVLGATWNTSQHLYVINNTIVNDYVPVNSADLLFVRVNSSAASPGTVARIENNIFLGPGTAIGTYLFNGTYYSGSEASISALHNLRVLDHEASPLASRLGFDYHLVSGSAAIDAAADPGTDADQGLALLPAIQYLHPADWQTRTSSGTAPDIGAYEYAVTANVPPVITQGASTTLTVVEDIANSTTLDASDVNGNTLTWSILTQGSKGVAAASGTGLSQSVTYTPTANLTGTDSFVVRVSDGLGGTDTITVHVTITAVNDAPMLATPIPDQAATVGVAFSYTVPVGTFTDVDSTLTWSSNESLGWLSFNATTRVFSGTPAAGDVAATTITVTASDGALSASDSFVLTVGANVAPVITQGASTTLTVVEDVAGSTTLDASDVNGNTLTWSILTQGSKGVAAASGTGLSQSVTYTPTANLTGTDSFVVRVSDGLGGTDTITVHVTITAVNDAPMLATPIPDQAATVGVAFSYTVPVGTFTDVDSTLTWSSNESLGWLSFNATTRVFSGTPAAGDVAATTITVTASDGALSASDSFVLTVGANVAPVITQGASTTLTVVEDVAGSTTLDASDVNGNTLTWSILTQGSKGVAAASGTGLSQSVTYTPTANLTGTDSFVVRVSDGLGGTDTITVHVTITAVNDAPMLATPIPDQAATVGVAFSYTVPVGTFTDVDSTLTWSSNESLGWLSFNATTRVFSGTPAAGNVAATTITVTASDGALSASDSFVLTVSSSTPSTPTPTSSSSGGGGCGAGAIGLLLALPLAFVGRRRRPLC